MKYNQSVVVVGLGEVGKPLFELLSEHFHTTGLDITLPSAVPPADVLHICFPFQVRDFVGETERYIKMLRPKLTIVNSTVGVGTTRLIEERTGSPVVNSPVRGKHARMLEELRHYTKFIGATNATAGQKAAQHFRAAGLKTRVLSSPEATELAKLTETTYFGLLIAWAQEVERYCDLAGTNYEEIVSFYEEIKYLPQVKFSPGVIGGHCVIPNIKILRSFIQSGMLEAMDASNELKIEREARQDHNLSQQKVAI